MTRPAPSAALLDRLARRFRGTPGHAAWVAGVAGGQPQELLCPPDDGVAGLPPRGLQADEDAETGGVVGVVGMLVGDNRSQRLAPDGSQPEAVPGTLDEPGVERISEPGEHAPVGRAAGRPAHVADAVERRIGAALPLPEHESGVLWDRNHAPDSESTQAPAQALPRGGHTELTLDRFAHEDARIRHGGGLPAVWSAYS